MPSCHHCGSATFRKNGSYRGVQRYVCKTCGRTFTDRGTRYSREVKEQAMLMYLNNVGIRKIALFTGASPAGVLKWIRKAGKELAAQLAKASETVQSRLPDVIEMDEIYTFVKKNGSGRSYGLLVAGDSVALLHMSSVTRAS